MYHKQSVWPWTSVNLCQLFVRLRDLPSTFHAPTGPFVNFPCIRGSIRQIFASAEHCVIFSKHYMRLRDLPSISVNFCTFLAPSVNIPCHRGTFVTFSQLSVQSRVYLPTFVNFLSVCGTFRQFSMQLRTLRQLSVHLHNLPLTSINFPCIRLTFRELSLWQRGLPSNFCVVAYICKHSLCQHNLPSTSVKFPWFHGIFRQHFLHPWDILSTSVNFPCICSTFHQLPSTFRTPVGSFVKNLRGRRTFRQHQSTFRASAGLIVNLRQLFVRPVDLPSTFLASAGPVNFVQLPSITR